MSLARSLAHTVFLAALVVTGRASGEPAAEAARSCSSSPPRAALGVIGCGLAQQLGRSAEGASVVVVDWKSDRELPQADALRERVRSALAGALRTGREATPSERSKLRVELSIEKSGGVLRVTAELRRATGLWQRIRHAKPHAEAHGFVEAPLDAELRALIPPPPLVVSEILKVKAPERGIVALACGPLGSDGGQELALVSRSSVRVGRISGRAFAERKRAAWSTLSAVAEAPLREPIASAEITAEGALRVGLTDRKDGLELSRELSVTERFAGLLPLPGGGCVARSGLGLGGERVKCSANEALVTQVLGGVLDAVAGSALQQLGREQKTAQLSGTFFELSPLLSHIGAELALGDADSDGKPELAFSTDTLDPAKDHVTLATLEGGKLQRRFDLPAPSVGAIAICSRREGPGMSPIVVASGDELWLIR